MRTVLALIFLIVLACPVLAEELHILLVADTGSFACNTGNQDLWIKNPLGHDIRLKSVEVWMGMSERGVADFSGWAYAYDKQTNTLRLLTAVGWDHYAEPTAPGGFRKSFAPDWVTLEAEQYLRLVASCSGYPSVRGNVALFIEYTN